MIFNRFNIIRLEFREQHDVILSFVHSVISLVLHNFTSNISSFYFNSVFPFPFSLSLSLNPPPSSPPFACLIIFAIDNKRNIVYVISSVEAIASNRIKFGLSVVAWCVRFVVGLACADPRQHSSTAARESIPLNATTNFHNRL